MFTDLHSHLVPGVDDGSQSLDESIEHLAALARTTVYRAILTPHLNADAPGDDDAVDQRIQEIGGAFASLRDTWRKIGRPPEIKLGKEIFARTPAALERVVSREEVTLGGSRYVLVEFGFSKERDALGVIHLAREAGREIIIAHPERYWYGKNPVQIARTWVEAGAHLQVNLGSLLGYYMDDVPHSRDVAWELLDAGIVSVLASDHHGNARSQPLHQEVEGLVRRKLGVLRADQLLRINPGRVFQDESID